MTDAKKPRELTEEEFYWLHLEGRKIPCSIQSTAVPCDRLIELMDMKAKYDELENKGKLLCVGFGNEMMKVKHLEKRIEKLREGLKQLRTDKIAIELLKQDDEAMNE